MALDRRRIGNLIASPRLAIGLIAYTGLYAFLGTLVPQAATDPGRAAAWDVAHPSLAWLVNALGLHGAYSNPFLLVPAALLALSTVACAWRRAGVARSRMRVLRSLAGGDCEAALTRASVRVPLRGDRDVALKAGAEALSELGVHGRRTGAEWTAESPAWATLGSPVFHWALVALFVVLAAGSLTRSEGVMGVPVGVDIPDTPASYRLLSSGPLHIWPSKPRLITVFSLDPDYHAGGIDRGAAPEVGVKTPDGSAVVARQMVYPNSPLKSGSLIVHPNDYGLAAYFALLGKDGSELARTNTLIDFDNTTPVGTAPSSLQFRDESGNVAVVATVTVQAIYDQGQLVPVRPHVLAAYLHAVAADGSVVASSTMTTGTVVTFPDGSGLKLLGVDYYARLSVVDDWTIPPLYATLALALMGVSLALLAPQYALVLGVVEDAEGGASLAAFVRPWRNVSWDARMVEHALREALDESPGEEGGSSV